MLVLKDEIALDKGSCEQGMLSGLSLLELLRLAPDCTPLEDLLPLVALQLEWMLYCQSCETLSRGTIFTRPRLLTFDRLR